MKKLIKKIKKWLIHKLGAYTPEEVFVHMEKILDEEHDKFSKYIWESDDKDKDFWRGARAGINFLIDRIVKEKETLLSKKKETKE